MWSSSLVDRFSSAVTRTAVSDTASLPVAASGEALKQSAGRVGQGVEGDFGSKPLADARGQVPQPVGGLATTNDGQAPQAFPALQPSSQRPSREYGTTSASDDGPEASLSRRAGLGVVWWGPVGWFGAGLRVAGAARGSELVLEVVDAVLKLDEPAVGGCGEALLGELDDPLELADLPAGVASLSPVGPPRVDQALALPATQRGWGDPEHVGDLGHRVERVVGVVGGQAPSLHAFMIPLQTERKVVVAGIGFAQLLVTAGGSVKGSPPRSDPRQGVRCMEVGLLLLRLITGLLAAGHGAQKLFGWFGGHGPRGAAGFVESLGWRPGRRFATLLGLAGTGEAAGAAEPLGAWAVAPPRPRHEVIVLLDDLDKAAARALGYARTLRPLSVTALHVAVDPVHARGLAEQWAQLGLDVPLEIVSCPDRDLPGAVRQALRPEEHTSELQSRPHHV